MEEVIIFMIFIICFLGVWVTKLSRKITQLEYEIVAAQMHFEKEYRDVLLILQKDTNAHTEVYNNIVSAVSKQVAENMKSVGELESKFNDLQRCVVYELYKPKKEGKHNGNKN